MAKQTVGRQAAKSSGSVARLKTLLAKRRNDLAWHHEVGRLVAQHVPKAVTYGHGQMRELILRLGLPFARKTQVPLYCDRDFALSYSEKELPSLKGLKFGQVSILTGIKDKKTRDHFRRLCQRHHWSMRELRGRIQEQIGRRSRARKRFDEQGYLGPQAALSTMLRLQDMWAKRCAPALGRDVDRLGKKMTGPDGAKVCALFDEACTAVNELLAAVKQARAELRRVRARGKARR